ncbi:MAG: restriction endonuclease subunit S [Candidatus Electrothrix sp. MAN1_4]|nr:restriction endonuclease subunit S [Candidatus Electrothrix sp. MAN1_4]
MKKILQKIGCSQLLHHSISIFSGITPKSGGDAYCDKNDGIPFIRSGDFLEDGKINFDDLLYIKHSIHNGIMKGSKVKKNDLLMAIVGATIGKVGIYKDDRESNINQAIAAVRLRSSLTPEYARAFLLTSLGQKVIDRIKRPVARANINLEEVGTLNIPNLSISEQNKIVKVMDAAYSAKKEKEAEAERLLNSIDDYLLRELGIELPEQEENTVQSRIFTRRFSEISGGRFDPNFFQPYFKELTSSIRTVSYGTLGHIAKFSNETWNQQDLFTKTFPYIEIGEIDLAFGEVKNISYVNIKEAPSRAKMIVRGGDIVLSTTRPSRGAIVRIADTEDIFIASTGFSIIRKVINPSVTPSYLFHILRSAISLKQMEQRSSGGNYPAITQEELEKVIIPIPPLPKQTEIADHITQIRNNAKQLQQEAKQGLEQAKQEVEAMILGEDHSDV